MELMFQIKSMNITGSNIILKCILQRSDLHILVQERRMMAEVLTHLWLKHLLSCLVFVE